MGLKLWIHLVERQAPILDWSQSCQPEPGLSFGVFAIIAGSWVSTAPAPVRSTPRPLSPAALAPHMSSSWVPHSSSGHTPGPSTTRSLELNGPAHDPGHGAVIVCAHMRALPCLTVSCPRGATLRLHLRWRRTQRCEILRRDSEEVDVPLQPEDRGSVCRLRHDFHHLLRSRNRILWLVTAPCLMMCHFH